MERLQAKTKTYVTQNKNFKKIELWNLVFLKVTPKKNQLKLGKCYKLTPRYCGPFQNY
jgi:hypothetical protein